MRLLSILEQCEICAIQMLGLDGLDLIGLDGLDWIGLDGLDDQPSALPPSSQFLLNAQN